MNVTTELKQAKKREIDFLTGDNAIKQVLLLEYKDSNEDFKIAEALGNNQLIHEHNKLAKRFEMEKLEGKYGEDIFTLSQIKTLAKKYNMRFLPRKYYKGEMPVELIGKLKSFGKEYKVELTKGNLEEMFYMVAPEKQFIITEKEAIRVQRRTVFEDPAMFYKIDEDKFRLIYQWGADFNIWNRIMGFKWSSRLNHALFLTVLFSLTAMILNYFIPVNFSEGGWYNITALELIIPLLGFIIAYWDTDRPHSNLRYHDAKWRSNEKIKGEKTVTITTVRSGLTREVIRIESSDVAYTGPVMDIRALNTPAVLEMRDRPTLL